MDHKCRRCTYKQTREDVDYLKSIQKLKIITKYYDKACVRCSHVNPRCISKTREYDLTDEISIKRLNVDLSKIIHQCDSLKSDEPIYEKAIYDTSDRGNGTGGRRPDEHDKHRHR